MPDLPEEAVQAAVERAYKAGTNALEEYQTEPYNDLRLNAARASAKVVNALFEAGLLVSEEDIRADERRKTAETITAYEDLLGSIWLYIGWRYVTKQLTTEQKEMFADAVESSSRQLNDDDPSEPLDVDRWWRDDAPIRQIGEARV
jgi:hypothetical protein